MACVLWLAMHLMFSGLMNVDGERALIFHVFFSFKDPVMDENLRNWRFAGYKSSKTFPCLLIKYYKQLALYQQNSACSASGKVIFSNKFLGCQ